MLAPQAVQDPALGAGACHVVRSDRPADRGWRDRVGTMRSDGSAHECYRSRGPEADACTSAGGRTCHRLPRCALQADHLRHGISVHLQSWTETSVTSQSGTHALLAGRPQRARARGQGSARRAATSAAAFHLARSGSGRGRGCGARRARLVVRSFVVAQPAHKRLVAAGRHQHAAAAVVLAAQDALRRVVVVRQRWRAASPLLLLGARRRRALLLLLLRVLCTLLRLLGGRRRRRHRAPRPASAPGAASLRRRPQAELVLEAGGCKRGRGGRGAAAAAAAAHAPLLGDDVVAGHDVLPKVGLALQGGEGGVGDGSVFGGGLCVSVREATAAARLHPGKGNSWYQSRSPRDSAAGCRATAKALRPCSCQPACTRPRHAGKQRGASSAGGRAVD